MIIRIKIVYLPCCIFGVVTNGNYLLQYLHYLDVKSTLEYSLTRGTQELHVDTCENT